MVIKLPNKLIIGTVSVVSTLVLIIFVDIYAAMYLRANHDHFSISVNSAGEMQYIDSTFDIHIKDCETAAALALANLDDSTVSVLGKKWQYSVETTDTSRFISFVDITDVYWLHRNIKIALCVFHLLLIILSFALVRFLALRSIRPMINAWESQRRFIADASHELKTPLAALSANLDVLSSSPDDTVKNQAQWIDNSKKVIGHMTDLVKSMLELAGADEPRGAYSAEEININDLIDETMDFYMPRAARKRITVSEDIKAGIKVYSNYGLIQQVAEILMDNAVAYTDEGGRITVYAFAEKNAAVIKIQNTGKGIAAEDIGKVFDRFYRGDKARVQQDGNYGLGLSIANSAVQKLNGSISAQSDAQYTCFTVRIPALLHPPRRQA